MWRRMQKKSLLSEWNRETRHDKAENSWSNHCWYFKIIKLCGIYTLNHQTQLAGLCNSSNRYNSTSKTGSPLANFIPVRKWNRQHAKSRRIGTIRLKNPVHAEWAVPPPPLHRLQYHSAVTAKHHFSTSRGNKRQNCMFFFCSHGELVCLNRKWLKLHPAHWSHCLSRIRQENKPGTK